MVISFTPVIILEYFDLLHTNYIIQGVAAMFLPQLIDKEEGVNSTVHRPPFQISSVV